MSTAREMATSMITTKELPTQANQCMASIVGILFPKQSLQHRPTLVRLSRTKPFAFHHNDSNQSVLQRIVTQ